MPRHTHEGDRRDPITLTVPGLIGTGPTRWQTLWEQSRPDTQRVELGMLSAPRRNAWVTKLDQAIRSAQPPIVLAAHSLGCLAVAWWAKLASQPYGWPVAGAFLVAPPDLQQSRLKNRLNDFAPIPLKAFPFPSVVIASEGDPWIDLGRAQAIAASWGSHFVNAGAKGHLDTVSGIGWWEEGERLLDRALLAAGAEGRAADAKTILAINATEAAWADMLGRS